MRKSCLLKFLPPAACILLVLSLWYAVSALGILNAYILPPPLRVLQTFVRLVSTKEIFADIGISLVRVARGFAISFVIAFALGMVSSVVPPSKYFFEYLVHFFKNVPPISMIPLLILWCGIGETTKTVIIVLASFFPMYMNIVKGFTTCDRKLIEVGEAFHYSKIRIFLGIILPNAVGDILVGMRIGLGYAWRAIIGAEMVAASTGLGHMILFAQQMSRTDKVIVGILVIGLAGYVSDRLFALLMRKILRGAEVNDWN